MTKLSTAVMLALVLIVAIGRTPGRAAAPALVADRCNGQTIDEASARVRDYDRHGPGGSTPEVLARFGAIADVIAVLNEEREILGSICASDTQRAQFFTQIAATAALALGLEADLAARLNASCPAAAKALPAMMLSDAWLTLANVVNEGGGTVPSAFGDVIPKIQTRAQAVDLTLPVWAETSAYWRDQVHSKAKAAVATCPSPSPAPTPTATPT
jgi:hypothetical protein